MWGREPRERRKEGRREGEKVNKGGKIKEGRRERESE
jgi:hypothetical protein